MEMGKTAYLKVEQLAHNAPSPTKQVSYGCFRFCTSLYFDGLSKWLIGRSPDMTNFPDQTSIYCIYLPSIFITRTLAVIHASKSVYENIHILESVSDKQRLVDSVTGQPLTKKPLKDGDAFQAESLPFFKFKYAVVSDNDVSSGDISKNTIY